MNKFLGVSELAQILEQILNDCEDGVNENLVILLKNKPELFYILLDTNSTIAKKHTNILNHIISNRNFSLLTALINAGLKDVLKDVFEKTQYNILYSDYPNALLSDDKQIATNIKEGSGWEPLLTLLMTNSLLPNEKIDKFSWAIINRPNTLRVAFDKNYFEKPHDQYWENGLKKNTSSWVMIDFINSILLNDLYEFKKYCIKDFDTNGLTDVSFLNDKMCFYLPDFYIFHDFDLDLSSLIDIQQLQMKNWLKKRVFKIKKVDLSNRIYNIFESTNWLNNWNNIHVNYANPWHFLTKNNFLNEQEYVEINSLDYAFLCQSLKSYQVIEQLIGSDSILESYLDKDTPYLVRNFLFSKKLGKSLIDKLENQKIVKI